jgi:FkbM family methyltransferase
MTVRLSSATRLGRLLRLPLRLIAADRVIRVKSGPLRGARWVAGSAVHGCWLGTYESSKARAFSDAVHQGDVVFDLGANAGYYTLIAARKVGPTGRVVAFEPVAENAASIRRHIDLNLLDNVEVIEAAVTDGASPTVTFARGENSSVGMVSTRGELTVPAVTIDAVARDGRAPSIMKIDIEGAEAEALAGSKLTLGARPTLFLATHGHEVERRCLEILQTSGYECTKVEDGEWVCR